MSTTEKMLSASGAELSVTSSDPSKSAVDVFQEWMTHPEVSVPIAAIQALTHVVRHSSKRSTVSGLLQDLKTAADAIQALHKSSVSLAGCYQLFNRYITKMQSPDAVLARSESFAAASLSSWSVIARMADRFLRDKQTVLVHGHSRTVTRALAHARAQGKHLRVIVTEARPACEGYAAARELAAADVDVTVIADTAVAYAMGGVDMVLCGAEGVVESGGLMARIGTLQVATVARALNKPVYALAESFRFVRMFPFSQQDLPETRAAQPAFVCVGGGSLPAGVAVNNPSYDYTPPELVSLLFTDLGTLTPSAISDELIKLHI